MKQYCVLLYYTYVDIDDPEKLRDEHRALCKQLNLQGRILIAKEGLNGTVAGKIEDTKSYKETLWSDERFANMKFKEHHADENPFHSLKVKVRPEVVALGVDDANPANAAPHLSPQEWHTAAQQEDVVILDARNNFESAIGKFENAITPDINYFREFPQWVKEHKEQLKNKKVLMYCTGGIRCERASVVLKQEGVEDVYQLDGGIINYGKEIKNGLWRGTCFVFDERISVPVNSHNTEPISHCFFCDKKTDAYVNCCNAECNKLILLCDQCKEKSNASCSEECSQKHRLGIVKHWDSTLRQAVEQR